MLKYYEPIGNSDSFLCSNMQHRSGYHIFFVSVYLSPSLSPFLFVSHLLQFDIKYTHLSMSHLFLSLPPLPLPAVRIHKGQNRDTKLFKPLCTGGSFLVSFLCCFPCQSVASTATHSCHSADS